MYSCSDNDDDNQTAVPPRPFLLQYSILSCTKWLTFSRFVTLQTANSCEMRMAGGLKGIVWKCAGEERVSLRTTDRTKPYGFTVLITTKFAYRLTAHRLSTNMLTHQHATLNSHTVQQLNCAVCTTCKCVSAMKCNSVLLHSDTHK
jgi:hypothetical protein